jgi:hypothetical protein
MADARSRRAEALSLAEDLLDDIELGRLDPVDIARRTSRLARLLDDHDAMRWLSYEVSGYPTPLTEEATAAAIRSNRRQANDTFSTGTLAELSASAHAIELSLQAAPPPSSSVVGEREHRSERSGLRKGLWTVRGLIQQVTGSFHAYVAERYQELRFGSAVESAFEVVREEVDGAIAELVPAALPMLASAFENATSQNSEDWAAAAATCRRLLKEVGDALEPPGPEVEGPDGKTIKMGEPNYINRLVAWIGKQSQSGTAAKLAQAELEYLGRRLDAADSAGQKGAHAHVTRADASRFITATYLIVGDVLRLRRRDQNESV